VQKIWMNGFNRNYAGKLIFLKDKIVFVKTWANVENTDLKINMYCYCFEEKNSKMSLTLKLKNV
jgi:hypothetical protein